MMESLLESLRATSSIGPELRTKILTSALILLILWLLRRFLLRLAFHRITDLRARLRWKKASGYVGSVVGILLIGRVWFEGIHSIATFLGLIGAGMAIALKEPVANLAGWAFVVWRRPFEVGDRIQLGEYAGDVIDIRVFQFTLMEIGNWVDADQSTGRIIHVPNGKVFGEVLANYSKGFQFIWNEIPVLVTFESNWENAKAILQELATKHGEYLKEEAEKTLRSAARKFPIFYSRLTPTVYTNVKDCGILLTIRYLCKPRQRRGTEQSIWEDILREFHKRPDIDFAYPTTRYYTHDESSRCSENTERTNT